MYLKTTIHSMVAVHQNILVIFYTFKGYQFNVIDARGAVHRPQLIFYTLEAAERQGRDWLHAKFCP